MTEDLRCRFCQEGTYRDIINPNLGSAAMPSEGFGGFGRSDGSGWRVLECNGCQNLQFFRLTVDESERRGWHVER
jgi:hypothetical protein